MQVALLRPNESRNGSVDRFAHSRDENGQTIIHNLVVD